MTYKNIKKDNQSSISFGASIADEKGSVLIATILILLLLTLIGLGGMNTASTDLKITRNYRVYNENLMLGDGAINYAKSLVTNNIVDITSPWVNDVSDLYTADPARYLKNGAAWDQINTPVLNQINVDQIIAAWGTIAAITPGVLPNHPNTQYVVYQNLNSPNGNSVVIVRSTNNNGLVRIEAGFRTN
jgi:Tfp pilus assembly protein PilX